MNIYSRIALVAASCALGLPLAACTAGITTASPAATSYPTASRHQPSPAASPAHSPSPSPSATASTATVRVSAPLRTFPIPPGATVQFNGSCPKQVDLLLGPVTPSRAMAFYRTVLPRTGYKITGDISSDGQNMMEIQITGHTYTGQVAAFSDMGKAIVPGEPSPDAGMPSEWVKNVVEVTLSLPGTPDSYSCPG